MHQKKALKQVGIVHDTRNHSKNNKKCYGSNYYHGSLLNWLTD